MKPKDLQFPFSWEKRAPVLQKRVLFVPDYYDQHDAFSMPSWQEIFGNDHPVHLEYCSGNGEWIFEKAKSNSDCNWIGVEMKFGRVRLLNAKAENAGITNLLIVCGEAHTFSKHYVKEGSIKRAYVNYPDPWPKDRHAKHRLIQEPFARTLARVIEPQGSAIFVTDDTDYKEQMVQVMSQVDAWKQEEQTTPRDEYGSSFFDRLWRGKGKDIYLLKFSNQS